VDRAKIFIRGELSGSNYVKNSKCEIQHSFIIQVI